MSDAITHDEAQKTAEGLCRGVGLAVSFKEWKRLLLYIEQQRASTKESLELDEELQKADDAAEGAGFSRGRITPAETILALCRARDLAEQREMEARRTAEEWRNESNNYHEALAERSERESREALEALKKELAEVRDGYHALNKNWEKVHDAAMRPLRRALGDDDASVGEMVQTIERLKLACSSCRSPSPTTHGQLRPAVAWFAWLMEEALRRNDYKGNWQDCEVTGYLWERLTEEKRELKRALADSDSTRIEREAADVANIAMMIADQCTPVRRDAAWYAPVPSPAEAKEKG